MKGCQVRQPFRLGMWMKSLRNTWILLPVLIAGCLGNIEKNHIAPGQLDVFGVIMYSSTDHREINGVRGTDEPCLRGHERSFDNLDIVIGYGRDGKIRKVNSRNPQNSMFGVHPGESVETALVKIREAGFLENGSPYRFKKDELELTMLVDGNGRIFGMTLEVFGPA